MSWSIPQQQLSETAPAALQERLLNDIAALPGVAVGPSHILVPGARALTLVDANMSSENFLVPSAHEFAHVDPSCDGSLHLVLSADQAADLVAHGRERMHPWAGTRLSAGFVMVYGPRDDNEVRLIGQIVEASYLFAINGVASGELA